MLRKIALPLLIVAFCVVEIYAQEWNKEYKYGKTNYDHELHPCRKFELKLYTTACFGPQGNASEAVSIAEEHSNWYIKAVPQQTTITDPGTGNQKPANWVVSSKSFPSPKSRIIKCIPRPPASGAINNKYFPSSYTKNAFGCIDAPGFGADPETLKKNAQRCRDAVNALRDWDNRVMQVEKEMEAYCLTQRVYPEEKVNTEYKEVNQTVLQLPGNSTSGGSNGQVQEDGYNQSDNSVNRTTDDLNNSSNSYSDNNSYSSQYGPNINEYNSYEQQLEQQREMNDYVNQSVNDTWDFMNYSDAELQRRFDDMRANDARFEAFRSSLTINNELTPQAMIDEYRRKCNEVDNFYNAELQKTLVNIGNLAAENANVKGAGWVAAGGAAVAAAAAADSKKQAKKEMEYELEKEFKKIQKELLRKEEPKIKKNEEAAARSLNPERERFYLNWAKYWKCRVGKIKSDFSIKHTRWLDPDCNRPSTKTPPAETTSSAANGDILYTAAKRKKSASSSNMDQYADKYLDAALNKEPKNSDYLFMKYQWTKDKDYLEMSLRANPEHKLSRESMRYELAKKDRVKGSYQSYLDKYPNGLYRREAKKAVNYFESVETINGLIASNNLESATTQFDVLKKTYPYFYRPSDVPNQKALDRVYEERAWSSLGNRKNTDLKGDEKRKSIVKLYNNFLSEYPNTPYREDAEREMTKYRARMHANRVKLDMFRFSPTSSTSIDARNGIPGVAFGNVTYSNDAILSSLRFMQVDYRIGLLTMNNPYSFIGLKLGADMTMMNNSGLTPERTTNANQPEFMYYNEPFVALRAGLTFGDFFEFYGTFRAKPEFGIALDEDKIFKTKEPTLEIGGDDSKYTGGYGLQVLIPFTMGLDAYVAGAYETTKWASERDEAVYNLTQIKFVYKYFSLGYEIVNLETNVNSSRNIEISYSAVMLGWVIDFNYLNGSYWKQTKKYRRINNSSTKAPSSRSQSLSPTGAGGRILGK